MPAPGRNRYLLLRRLVQASVVVLFVAGNEFGWRLLQGNLSTSRLLGTVTLADPYTLLQVLCAGTLVGAEALLGGAIVVLFFGVLGGRVFCSWVCPLNVVTDLAAGLRRTTGLGRWVPSRAMGRNARYWVLVLGLVLSALLGIAAFEWISPISMLHRGLVYGMGWGWAMVAAVFLLDLLVVQEGFCGHLCPLGGLYAVIGRFGMLHVRHQEDRCSRCMLCLERCPEPQVLPMIGKQSGPVLSGECTNCGRCIDVCPDQAMSFGIRLPERFTAGRKGG